MSATQRWQRGVLRRRLSYGCNLRGDKKAERVLCPSTVP
jgi:hypothetical protein